MKLKPLGQAKWNAEKIVETLWEKMEQLIAENPDAVNCVGPIDQHAAPDHNGKQREVDPMQPPYG